MAAACPKCGWQPIGAAKCPRCGVDIERYREDLRAASAVAAAAGAAARTADSWPVLRAAAPEHRPAGFWIRFTAVIIDAVVLVALQAALFLVAQVVFLGASPVLIGVAARAFGGALGAAYPVIFHWLWGQTLGKMAVGARVVTTGGGALSLGCAVVRQLASWFSALLFGIGYLIVALRTDKRALHDLIAGTRVERLS